MDLNLRQVEAFRAVMLTGGMTSAAELLSVTQPAVSRLIRDFEAATRLALFERRGNQLLPTQAAVTLMAEVERSFVGLSRIGALAEAIGRQSAGSLRIAAMPALATGILARFLGTFLKERPDLHVTLLGLPSHLVIEAVAAGQADIGYAEGPLDRPGFSIEAKAVPAVVALPEGHRLAAKSVIAPADLAGERFIGLGPGTIFGARVEVALADVARSVMLETRLSHTACTLVAEGLGVCIVDPTSAMDFVGRGLVMRPFGVFVDAGFLEIRHGARAPAEIVDRFAAAFSAYQDAILVDRG